jgi:hypothetical protein
MNTSRTQRSEESGSFVPTLRVCVEWHEVKPNVRCINMLGISWPELRELVRTMHSGMTE